MSRNWIEMIVAKSASGQSEIISKISYAELQQVKTFHKYYCYRSEVDRHVTVLLPSSYVRNYDIIDC